MFRLRFLVRGGVQQDDAPDDDLLAGVWGVFQVDLRLFFPFS